MKLVEIKKGEADIKRGQVMMAAEIVFMNDEGSYLAETPEQRWTRMRKWVGEQLKP